MTEALRRAAKRQPLRRAPTRPSMFESAEQTTSHDELVAVKASLEAISAGLNAVDAASLSDAEHERWSREVNQVDLAIARVRNSLLNGIVAEFEAALPEIQSRTASLEADLARLKQAVDVINAVAGAIGVIEQIITLGR